MPIAFTSDHIETLHELDIEYGEDLAKKVIFLLCNYLFGFVFKTVHLDSSELRLTVDYRL